MWSLCYIPCINQSFTLVWLGSLGVVCLRVLRPALEVLPVKTGRQEQKLTKQKTVKISGGRPTHKYSTQSLY